MQQSVTEHRVKFTLTNICALGKIKTENTLTVHKAVTTGAHIIRTLLCLGNERICE